MKIKPEIHARIIHAANTLTAEGVENPTNEQIRERLGGGSLSHISPVMREWRESKKAEIVAALEMPGELKKVIDAALGQVWTAASKLASATVESFRLEAQNGIEAAISERDEALNEITRLEAKITDFENLCSENEKKINQYQSDLEINRNQHTKLITDNATLNARIEDRNFQIDSLRDEIKGSRADNKTLQAELIAIAKTDRQKSMT